MNRGWATRGLLGTHLLSTVGEWAVIVGVLVHAFSWGGARAVGIVSLVLLVPPLVGAPVVGAAQSRWRTLSIRATSLVTQVICFAAAAVASASDAPTPLVATFAVAGLAALVMIPPTTAALLPQMAGSTERLVKANLWVTHCDSASGLVGSLTAGLIVGFGGPTAVFVAGAGAAAMGLFASTFRAAPNVRSARGATEVMPKRVLRRTMAEFREHPWARGVLCLASARNLILGSFDVLLVILALELLDLGDAGVGYLGALVGAGSLASTLVTTSAVRRAKLRGALVAAVMVAATLTLVLGLRIERPVVFLVLPVVGLAMATMDGLSRALLLRATDPRSLAPLYASLGVVAGLSQIIGSAVAQVSLAVGDARLAFVVVGCILLALVALSVGSLRHADNNAEVPVVEMALLAGLPMLSALPTAGLERVARATESVALTSGQPLITEGVPTDTFSVISDGTFEVRSNGRIIGEVGRGHVVGEVALLTNTTPNTSVVAVTDGEALRVGRRSFMLALTGQDLPEGSDTINLAEARDRYRDIVAGHQRLAGSPGSERPDAWLGLGATGRMLGDYSYTEVLATTAQVAEATSNEVVLAEAAAMATLPGAFFLVADNPDEKMIDLCERALARLGPEDPMRIRVLATLASNLAFVEDSEARRRTLIAEAHELSARHDDPALEGAILNSEFIALWDPSTLERRAEIGPRLAEIGRRIGDRELQYVGRFFDAFCMAERGRLDAARVNLVELRELAPVTANQYFEFLSERLLLSIDIAQGRSGVQERIDALAATHADTYADTDGTWALQVGGLAYESGTLGTMVPVLAEMVEGPHGRTWRAALALAHISAEQPDEAAAVIADGSAFPRSYFWLTATQTHAEVVANLRDVEACRRLYDELLPYRGQVGITASGSRLFGLVSRSLGELALALGRPEAAIDLLGEAIVDSDAIGMPFEATISRRLCGEAWVVRGDLDRARECLDEGMRCALDRGFDREAALMRRLLDGEIGESAT